MNYSSKEDSNKYKTMNNCSNSIKSLLTLSILTIICLLPFINKAFHIDDTLFLWCAKQIQLKPFDFYGFTANWHGTESPMYLINQNPPLVSYYIAFITSFFGWKEIVLHSAFIPVAVITVFGIYFLSKHFCKAPKLSALIALFSPVFIVSATNIMSDIFMLNFFIWAIVLWIYGQNKNKNTYLLLSTVCISLSILTKYFALSLIPLLFVYNIYSNNNKKYLVFLLLPILVVIGYQAYTHYQYNNYLITNAARYALNLSFPQQLSLLINRISTGLSFTGGCMICILFFSPFLWSRQIIFLFFLLFITLFGFVYFFLPLRLILIPGAKDINVNYLLQYSIFMVTGIQILTIPIISYIKNKDSKSLLLFLWIFGTFIFTTLLNWSVTSRTILPMVPAVSILTVKRLNYNRNFNLNYKYYLILIPSALLAILVAYADTSLANCQRSTAQNINILFDKYPHSLWYQGHWGFQYYMETKTRAKAFNFINPKLSKGDLIIIPTNNTNFKVFSNKNYKIIFKIKTIAFPFLSSMSKKCHAGFYCNFYGSIPYFFGKISPEEYLICRKL